jgi:sugar phosphate isomerase/epimerase
MQEKLAVQLFTLRDFIQSAEGIRFGHHNHSREFHKPERHGKTLENIVIEEGVMDWGRIIPACERAGVDGYTIEQDTCARDPFDCLQSSFDYLANRKWDR